MAKRKTTKSKGRKAPKPVRRSCASVQSFFAMLDDYPQYRFNQAAIESFTSACLRAGESAFRSGVITIPVVIHVVYRTTQENISENQVKSQLTVLNKDFRAKNADISKVPQPFRASIGDARVEFKLAETDPNGQPTNGITRTETDRNYFLPPLPTGGGDDVKSSTTGGIYAWDTKRYLNIWVCTLNSTLLGYAQFPGGPPSTDGVVIRNTAFGTSGTAAAPFHKGRTTSHEVGHYLNLSHIWGESRFDTCSDSDFVDDTPNQFGPNGGKPTFPSVSCSNVPHGDMFMNYMDYVDDAAMFMFTKGQVARMQATLAGPRSELGT